MKLPLLTVGLTLVCGLHALKNNIEDPKKIIGDWYTVQVASNVTSKIEEGGSLLMFVHNLRVYNGLLNGEFFKRIFLLLVGLERWVETDCMTWETLEKDPSAWCAHIRDGAVLYEQSRTEIVQGKCKMYKFRVSSPNDHDGLNDFSIQSVDSQHLIYILYNYKDDEVTVWGKLYVISERDLVAIFTFTLTIGREKTLPEEIKKKFEKICESFGIRKDQIRDLSNDDRCQKLR
ncbi:major urinary protein-like [Petaurus breviceps papuanus]|uniref:major urinary protein-like n=1 Tax=Petaurus breviceps papuanus TaxID=3040969 RepID=UPI0036D9D09C